MLLRCEKRKLQIVISLSTKKAQPVGLRFIFDITRLIANHIMNNI